MIKNDDSLIGKTCYFQFEDFCNIASGKIIDFIPIGGASACVAVKLDNPEDSIIKYEDDKAMFNLGKVFLTKLEALMNLKIDVKREFDDILSGLDKQIFDEMILKFADKAKSSGEKP